MLKSNLSLASHPPLNYGDWCQLCGTSHHNSASHNLVSFLVIQPQSVRLAIVKLANHGCTFQGDGTIFDKKYEKEITF